MKTFRIIVLLLVLGINATAQENQNFAKILDTYVGTWVYQKNDTVFKIKFQKGQQLWTKKTANGLYGGYYLSVNGRVLEDYMGELPTCWDVLKECQPNNLFIWAYSPYTDELGSLGIIFYDQHVKDTLVVRGLQVDTYSYCRLLRFAGNWIEEKGIWNETEGDESISDAGRRPIGFSVPDDVIMTKE